MALIRIFRTREQAEFAQKILKDGGIPTEIEEDQFHGVPIQKFGVPARFRLTTSLEYYEKAALYLVNKMKKLQLKG